MAGFTACKKESNTTSPAMGNTQNLEQLILNFEQKLNSGQKDGTTYAIDSAVWYVEALLNYNLGSVGIECSSITVDTVETNLLILATGEYTLSQLETIYSELLDKITESQPTNTIVFAADLYNYQVETVMVFAVQVAYATPLTPQLKSLNDTTGYWYWGGDLGMCDPDSGLYVGMDATDVLEAQIGNATSGVWTNIQSFDILPPWPYDPNFPFDIQYLQPTRLFYAEGPWVDIHDFCIPPAVMNYYLSSNGIPYLINELKPTGKRFIYCAIDPIWIDAYSIGHQGAFVFGIPLH